jgi:hypothetical protein|uniref:Uncharacterized protein n=1 Tax=Populus trichocarpa TaxID=3694 RepID=A0A3N7FH42_POPTR
MYNYNNTSSIIEDFIIMCVNFILKKINFLTLYKVNAISVIIIAFIYVGIL